MNDQSTFASEVWETLSNIDVEPHINHIEATAKRPEIPYLAWHRAWTLTKRAFPATTYQHLPDILHPDETVEVEVKVMIAKDSEQWQIANARLGVMDQWFNPITNPTARQINDSRQRCLVKALAFAGLGLNLWSESVVPVGKLDDPVNSKQVKILKDLIKKSGTDEAAFLEWAGTEKIEDIPHERYGSARRLLESRVKGKSK
jgi:hypothetical protein